MKVIRHTDQILVIQAKPYQFWIGAGVLALAPLGLAWAICQTSGSSDNLLFFTALLAGPCGVGVAFCLFQGRTVTTQFDKRRRRVCQTVGRRKTEVRFKQIAEITVERAYTENMVVYHPVLKLTSGGTLSLTRVHALSSRKPLAFVRVIGEFLGDAAASGEGSGEPAGIRVSPKVAGKPENPLVSALVLIIMALIIGQSLWKSSSHHHTAPPSVSHARP